MATETSIYRTVLEHIEKAKHYIYIENQYFISNTNDPLFPAVIQNRIAAALVRRITKAIEMKEVGMDLEREHGEGEGEEEGEGE